MHASLLIITAIALAGQLNGTNVGGRYENLGAENTEPAELPADIDTTAPAQPLQENLQPLGTLFQSGVAPSETPPSGSQGFDVGAVPLGAIPLPSGAAPPQLKPSQLLRSFLEEPLHGKLAGNAWALGDVVQSARTREEQTRCVQAYWGLVAAVAQYNLSLEDVVRLKALQASVIQPGSQWLQELHSLETRVQIAGRTAKVAQHRLQRLLGRSADESLPLPSDVPHCGAYDTRFEEIFADRDSQQAGQLNKLIALNHQSIQSQANGVAAANQWLQSVSQTRNPNTDGEGLLKAYELLTLRRSAFINAVRDYNVNIASYAEIASPGKVGTGRLVAMLIGVSPEQRQLWETQEIRRASAEEPLDDRPRTFADGDQNLRRRAETPPDGVNRSILTQPKSRNR